MTMMIQHWDIILSVLIFILEQVLPKLKCIPANSTTELIAMIFRWVLKSFKGR
jgi:hypothetical protein